ncbi:hypothetical protein [Planomicrobium okeanokoites]
MVSDSTYQYEGLIDVLAEMVTTYVASEDVTKEKEGVEESE